MPVRCNGITTNIFKKMMNMHNEWHPWNLISNHTSYVIASYYKFSLMIDMIHLHSCMAPWHVDDVIWSHDSLSPLLHLICMPTMSMFHYVVVQLNILCGHRISDAVHVGSRNIKRFTFIWIMKGKGPGHAVIEILHGAEIWTVEQ